MIDTEVLREKISDLAIQGKLTEQVISDEGAEALYVQIQEKKERLIKEGRIRKEKDLPEIEVEEKPFELPDNWKWVRLGEMCLQITDGTHKTPVYQGAGIPFLSVKNISSGKFDLSEIKYISEAEHNDLIKRCKPEKNDVLVCRIGTLGKAKTIDIDLEFSIFVSLGLIKTTGKTISDYIALVINSGYGNAWISANKAGGAMHTYKINLNSLALLPIPLAPLHEMEEILKKVDEVNSLVSYIKKMQESYDRNLSVLRGKIIDAGIRGKLTKQLPEDGSAENFRREATKYKENLSRLGVLKNRKNKEIKEIGQDDYLFELPSSWRWFRLGEIAEVFGRIGFRGYQKTDLVLKGQGAITMSPSNILSNGDVNFDDSTYISWEKYEESPEIMLQEGDIVLVKTGSSYGKCGIIDKLPEKATINPQLAILKYIQCNRKYLFYVLQSSAAWAQYESFVVGAATPTFSQEKLSNMMTPIPPMGEQERIVNMIDYIIDNMRKRKSV